MMTDKSCRDEIRNLGTEINPQMVSACVALYSRFLPDTAQAGVRIERDIAYGAHEGHRLHIFISGEGGERPDLLYVQGGGFVAGDNTLPGTPFYDNIGIWAAQQGFV